MSSLRLTATRTPRPHPFSWRSMKRYATGASARAITLCLKLSAAASPGEPLWCVGPEEPVMTLALAFPGQGSQSVGMMAPFETLRGVRETFELASAALGIDLWAMVRDGPPEELEKTVNTQ